MKREKRNGAVELRHLYKKFQGDILFEDFSITFPKDQVTGISGPSGGGKTTLLRMIAGLEPMDKGELFGVDPLSVSFVFQEDRLLPWLTVEQNVALVLKGKMGEEQQKMQVQETLGQMHLTKFRDYLPNRLSGGMQRRVAIGRALAYDGELLLMDEPFKGLDQELRKDIINDLTAVWKKKKKTVLVITHDVEDTKNWCHQIIELSGRPVKSRIIFSVDNMQGPAHPSAPSCDLRPETLSGE